MIINRKISLSILAIAIANLCHAVSRIDNLREWSVGTKTASLEWDSEEDYPFIQFQRRIQGESDWINLPVKKHIFDRMYDSFVQPNTSYQYQAHVIGPGAPNADYPLSDIVTVTTGDITVSEFVFYDPKLELDVSMPGKRLLSLVYGEGTWVGISPHGEMVRSTDGTSWEVLHEGWTRQSTKLYFSKGTWYAIRANYIYYANDPADTWKKVVQDIEFVSDLHVLDDYILATYGSKTLLLNGELSWNIIPTTPPGFSRVFANFENGTFVTSKKNTIYTAEYPGSTLIPTYTIPEGLYAKSHFSFNGGTYSQLKYLTSSSNDSDSSPTSSNEQLVRLRDDLEIVDVELGTEGVFMKAGDRLIYFDTAKNRFRSTYDGLSWSSWQPSTLQTITSGNKVQYGKGKWLVAGDNGEVYESYDFADWQQVYAFDTSNYNASITSDTLAHNGSDTIVLYGDHRYNLPCTPSLNEPCIGPLSVTNLRFFTINTDNGETTEVYPGITRTIRDIMWDGSRFVAFSQNPIIYVSEDGYDWSTIEPINIVDNLLSIAYGNGVYVACGINEIATSTDLINWTKLKDQQPAPYPTGSKLQFTGGKFFYLGQYQSSTSYVSENGIEWTPISVPNAESVTHYVDNEIDCYLIVSINGIYKSSDSTSWNRISDIGDFSQVLHNGQFFMALRKFGGATAGGLWVSIDGENWSHADPASQGEDTKAEIAFIKDRIYLSEEYHTLRSLKVSVDSPDIGSSEIGYSELEFKGQESSFESWARIRVDRDQSYDGSVKARLRSTGNGSATEGLDYEPIDITLEWESRELDYRYVPIRILEDNLTEGPETVELELTIIEGDAVVRGPTIINLVIQDKPLNHWLYTHFKGITNSDTSATGDWDKDGVPNFIEYTINSNPRNSDSDLFFRILSIQPNISFDDIRFLKTHFQTRSDHRITVSVEESKDLINWESYSVKPQAIPDSSTAYLPNPTNNLDDRFYNKTLDGNIFQRVRIEYSE